MPHECAVEESVVIRVPRRRVFDALTVGEQLARWWPRSATPEVREGGKIRFTWFDGGALETAFSTLSPDAQVAYRFYDEDLSFHLKDHADGTHLTVTHRCSHKDSVHIAGSWGFLKANLKAFLEKGIDLREGA